MGEKLGQNFLVNKETVKKIVVAADLQPADLVVEIGPGKGILTEELAQKAGKIVAVEIDSTLIAPLKNKFKNQKNMEIVEGDILKINLRELVETRQCLVSTEGYRVIANIPYYITAPIIRKFLESDFPPSEMILMVQKEVAERITAKAGKMSILAVSVQYYAQAEILFAVPRVDFEPVPAVDSAVIRISHIAKRETQKEEVKNFFRVVRVGFCAKRKTLANNLANSFHLPKKEVEEKIISVGFKPNVRAQELSVADWKKLAHLFLL